MEWLFTGWGILAVGPCAGVLAIGAVLLFHEYGAKSRHLARLAPPSIAVRASTALLDEYLLDRAEGRRVRRRPRPAPAYATHRRQSTTLRGPVPARTNAAALPVAAPRERAAGVTRLDPLIA
ncbi:MAG: hypothetical protein ACRDI2_02495 [Chloroflexota bacterium]